MKISLLVSQSLFVNIIFSMIQFESVYTQRKFNWISCKQIIELIVYFNPTALQGVACTILYLRDILLTSGRGNNFLKFYDLIENQCFNIKLCYLRNI